MRARTQLDEARRWAKFPATLLSITCLLWLIVVVSRVAQDWDGYVAQPSETLVGALGVLLKIPVVLFGCPLAAIGMLYVQRQALYVGAVLPFIPLTIAAKFHEYRSLGQIGSFGDAVLDAFILAGLWVICGLHVDSLRRAVRELNKAEQWSAKPVRDGAARSVVATAGVVTMPGPIGPGADAGDEGEDMCFLLPETPGGPDD
jgi:hypothetical protein